MTCARVTSVPPFAHNVYRVVLTAGGEVDVAATQARRRGKAPVRAEEEAFEIIPG